MRCSRLSLITTNPPNMFKLHKNIFVTFHPDDFARASRKIAQLSICFPKRSFLGRHLPTSRIDCCQAIQKTTLTIILETGITHTSLQVMNDVHISLEKSPPNEILCISLEEGLSSPCNSALGQTLTNLGIERILGDPAVVGACLDRHDLLFKHEERVRQATKTSKQSTCNR